MPTWDQQKLQDYIDNEVEESLSLDYKATGSLEKTDDKRWEVTKDVSSFANSDGGIIIYGISEYKQKDKKHLPENLSPIDKTQFSKEWLEHVIGNIRPKITGLLIHPVSLDSGSNEVAHVVEIPKSTNAHQAQDKKYYKRFNFESVAMEDYEIRQPMNRSTFPILKISSLLALVNRGPDSSLIIGNIKEMIKTFRIDFRLAIENNSLTWAKNVVGGIIGWGSGKSPNLTSYAAEIVENKTAELNSKYKKQLLLMTMQEFNFETNTNLSPFEVHEVGTKFFEIPQRIGSTSYFQEWNSVIYLVAENSPPTLFWLTIDFNLEIHNLPLNNDRIKVGSNNNIKFGKISNLAPIDSCKITGTS